MANEYRNMLAVAGMKAKKRMKRTSQGLPSLFFIYFSLTSEDGSFLITLSTQ